MAMKIEWLASAASIWDEKIIESIHSQRTLHSHDQQKNYPANIVWKGNYYQNAYGL